MDLTINDWNDVTSYLNGYILSKVVVENHTIFGVNTMNQKMVLAVPSSSYWKPVDGPSYEVVDRLIAHSKEQIKASGDYSSENKEKILKENFENFIRLFHKAYKN